MTKNIYLIGTKNSITLPGLDFSSYGACSSSTIISGLRPYCLPDTLIKGNSLCGESIEPWIRIQVGISERYPIKGIPTGMAGLVCRACSKAKRCVGNAHKS